MRSSAINSSNAGARRQIAAVNLIGCFREPGTAGSKMRHPLPCGADAEQTNAHHERGSPLGETIEIFPSSEHQVLPSSFFYMGKRASLSTAH
jgi:hypothetical protein